MADEQKTQLRLEIAHVLFIDIVGYSKLLIDEQSEALQELNTIVRSTEAARTAEAAGQLIILPTGDGMAIVFTGSVEDPVECALQISQRLRAQPSLPVRMGIHSGPVHHVADVNQRENIAGAGINIAQRVMDCGDAGHILISKRVADDLAQYRRWQPYLHELGDFEVKHGVVVSIVNLYADVVGNPNPPERLKQGKRISPLAVSSGREKRSPMLLPVLVVGFMLFTLAVLAIIFAPAILKQARVRQPSPPVPAVPTTPSALSIPEKSIAVLPFENLSRDPDNAFFTDGVQDEILTHLARIADLKVISRTSVMQFKTGVQRNLREIGQQLGVAHVLEGSVQRANNRIRVNAQLIDARNDAHLWAQTYDRDLADVFAIQSEIAKAIADQLQARILPQEQHEIDKQPTKDLAAYDLYVRARAEINVAPNSDQPKEHFFTAVNLLKQALARDPRFVGAYCRLAEVHDRLYLFGADHTPQRLALAEEALNAALGLQPDSPEAHLARAGHLYAKLDYDGARAEMENVHRTLPNNARAYELSGYIDRRQGRWEESTRNLERAIQLDPNNTFTLQQLGTSYEYLGDYIKEAAALDRVLSLEPNNFDARVNRATMDISWKADPRPLHELIASAIRNDQASARSLATIRVLLAFAERDASGGLKALTDLGENTFGPDAVQFPRAVGEGMFARLKGDEAAAQRSFAQARDRQEKIVDAQPDYGPVLCVLAVIDAGLGRKEDAMREARHALELTPLNKDSINGAHMISLTAMIYSWIGEKDLAIEELQRAVQTPGAANYGYLKLFPQWDPLRGDQHFEKIVASLAPKE